MFDLVLFGLLLLSTLLVHLHRRRFVLAVGENKVRYANLHLNNLFNTFNQSSCLIKCLIKYFFAHD